MLQCIKPKPYAVESSWMVGVGIVLLFNNTPVCKSCSLFVKITRQIARGLALAPQPSTLVPLMKLCSKEKTQEIEFEFKGLAPGIE
jgi:hypothetical protein